MSIHHVSAGECLPRIAAKYRFGDPETIWNHSANAALKNKRANPNILHPGDTLFIPEKRDKQEARATDQSHVFRVHRPVKLIRIVLENEDGSRLARAPYRLRVESGVYRGCTDGQGLLSQEVPLDAEEGELQIEGHTWPLKVGHLNPMEQTPDGGASGIKARLRNLGYDPGPLAEPWNDASRGAIRAFQQDNGLPSDGLCAPGSPTLAKLNARHGC